MCWLAWGGNDMLDGGPGLDSAVFTGLRSAYAVTVSGGLLVVVIDLLVGRDSTDTLTSVERLRLRTNLWSWTLPVMRIQRP